MPATVPVPLRLRLTVSRKAKAAVMPKAAPLRGHTPMAGRVGCSQRQALSGIRPNPDQQLAEIPPTQDGDKRIGSMFQPIVHILPINQATIGD